MQEYTTPGEVAVAEEETLTTSLFEAYDQHPTRPAFATRVGSTFQTISTKAFVDEVMEVAAGLMGLGIEAGDRVCIMSPTRYEWTVLDYAIWSAGAVTVPIYETSSAEQVEWIVGNSGAKALIVDDAELKARFDEVAGQLPDCENVFVIEDGALEEIKGNAGDIDAASSMNRAAMAKSKRFSVSGTHPVSAWSTPMACAAHARTSQSGHNDCVASWSSSRPAITDASSS